MLTTQKSCIKAFHVSCAMADPRILYNVYEVFDPPAPVEPGPDGVSPPSASPIKRMEVHLLCELHNPVSPLNTDLQTRSLTFQAQIEIRKQEAVEELKGKILALTAGSEIKVKSRGGGQMVGTFRRAIPETTQVEVEFDGGHKFLVPYDRVDFKETKQKVVVENEYGEC